MAVAKIGDINVHFEDSGEINRPALVFANSLGTDFRVWDALLPHFANRFRTIRYDKRGHGLSDLTAAPYTIEQLGGDLIGLFDHLQVKEAIIVGLSIGGMIAQSVAAQRPKAVRALILMDTAAQIGTAEMWNQRIETAKGVGIEAMAEAVLQRWFAPVFHQTRPSELALWRNMLTRTEADGYAACCAALRDADLTASTSQIKAPTLCIVGRDDGSTPPEIVESLSKLIPGSRFEIIEAAAHIPGVEQPEAVASVIEAFMMENALV